MGAFETVLASWLCHLMNSFAAGKKLGLAVNEVLFVLNVARNLNRRPDVAFVAYSRWPSVRCRTRTCLECRARLGHRNCQSHQSCGGDRPQDYRLLSGQVRLVWVFYPDSGRVYVYQSPTHVSILERTDTLDGGEVLPGFRLPIASLYEAVAKPA